MTLTALKSIIVGVVGALVLVTFATTFMALDRVFFWVPFLIGINGLISGYRLVEKLKETVSAFKLFAFVMGLGEGGLIFIALNFLGGRMEPGFFLMGFDLLLYILVSGISSYLGALLAIRYFKL